jgi:hypothetical protein
VLAGLWGAAGGLAPAQQPPPPTPNPGVEVLTRGPVHEAFATPTAEPKPTMTVNRQPPAPLDEMPPEDRPEGDVVWINGYWAWDDDRQDYLWVSGCWRAAPPGKDWVAGYWREADQNQWQWVPGFWHTAQAPAAAGQAAAVTYFPEPPAAPNVAPPPKPAEDTFWVPGHYEWRGDQYAWRAGFWTRVQPGFVWVPSHYRWTPNGYVFIAGYWDIAVARRGMLYAPVVVDYRVVGATYVYTPAYAVSDTVVLDTMFVRPCACHYYFGDYYEPRYRTLGYESAYVYSQRNYDSIVVYRTYEYRNEPSWISVQINLTDSRYRREAPVPPRTLVQQTTVVNNYTVVQNNQTIVNQTNVNQTNINQTNINQTNVNQNIKNTTVNYVVAPAKQVTAAKGMQTVPVDTTARAAAKQQAVVQQQAAVVQRKQSEAVPPGTAPKALTAPRVAAMNVPQTKAVTALPSAANPKGLQPPTTGVQHNTTANNTGHPNGAAGTNNQNVKLPGTGTAGTQTNGVGQVNNPNVKLPTTGTAGTHTNNNIKGPATGQQQHPGTTTPPPPPPQRPVVSAPPPPPRTPPPPPKKEEKKKDH